MNTRLRPTLLMLVEHFIFAASYLGTPRNFRHYLGGAMGLWARGRRQTKAWSRHTRRMRHLIDKIIPEIPNQRIVAVLGSGPLFDVPLQSLSHHFDKVMLVDIAHLWPAQRAARGLSNVELVWADLSSQTHPDPLGFLHALAGLDWVISVNLTSQLGANASESQERAVIDSHLDDLAALPCRVSLATDLRYKITDSQGALIEDFDLLYGRSMPKSPERWTWEVSPFGEESRTARRVHAMAFYSDWKRAGTSDAEEEQTHIEPGTQIR